MRSRLWAGVVLLAAAQGLFARPALGQAVRPDAALRELGDAPVTAAGSTTPRPLAARLAEYVDVLDYGAVPDDGKDDAPAFAAAIQAAAASGRAIVKLPPGRFELFASLRPYRDSGSYIRGVALEGAGHQQTRLRFHLNATADAIVLAGTGPDLARQIGYGGSLRGVTIESATAPGRASFRDGLSLLYWTDFSFDDVHVQYAARNAVRLINSWTIYGSRSTFHHAGAEALFAGAEPPRPILPTTVSFDRVYFYGSGTDGASVSVSGFNCWACIFEKSGARGDPVGGAGIVVRNGATVLSGCYFEANRGWDVVVGRRLSGEDAQFTTLTSHDTFHWSGGKAPSAGLFRIERANGGTIANVHPASRFEGPGVWIANDSDVRQLRLQVATDLWRNTGGVVKGDGSPLEQHQGQIERLDAARNLEVTGKFRIAPGLGVRFPGGDTITGFHTAEVPLPTISIPEGGVWSGTFSMQAAIRPDATLVGSLRGLGDAPAVFVSVRLREPSFAIVSVLNRSGAALSLKGATLRIDAFEH